MLQAKGQIEIGFKLELGILISIKCNLVIMEDLE
jgi:hypothetical protein